MADRLELVERWRMIPVTGLRQSALDLSDMSRVQLVDLARMLRSADAVVAFVANRGNCTTLLRGTVEQFWQPTTRAAAVRVATVCQATMVSAMLTLIECDRLDQRRLYRFGELLEQACACPCTQHESDDVACLAEEGVAAALG